jgi:hypothetical protein
MTVEHGYILYTSGCRCAVCRTAKSAYMRERRAGARAARRAAEDRGEAYIAAGIKHGISGYQNYSCRCGECRRAGKAASVRRRRRGLP